MHTILTIIGNELTDHQYTQLNDSSQREFRLRLPAKPEMSDRRYFLLVETETEKILASGYVKFIHPVLFNHETFSFLNIGGIIANEKGKGYGKQIMMAIRAHLISCDQTGLGFCFPRNQGFYEKCGFTVDTHSTQRFIYRDGGERRTAEGQYILYQEASDRFMENVLSHGDQEVFVPDPTIW
jgi:hypothetical protein